MENLGGAVEAYLSSHFSGFPNGVPPPGLYHRILKEIEVPLLTAALAATRGNQIRAADLLGLNRNTLRKKIRTSTFRSTGAAARGSRCACSRHERVKRLGTDRFSGRMAAELSQFGNIVI